MFFYVWNDKPNHRSSLPELKKKQTQRVNISKQIVLCMSLSLLNEDILPAQAMRPWKCHPGSKLSH